MHRRSIAVAALLLAGTTVLAACGDDDGQTSSGDMPAMDDGGHGMDGHDDEASPVIDGARRIEISASIDAFDPDEITAEVGEDLAIILTSQDMLHDFTIDELDAHVAADRGKTAEGGVTVDDAGTYTYYCSVPGHRQAGMEGTLTVTGT
jgi:plastocyanin